MDLAQLEADLLARWGREELTVYADYLQSIGDPRGEVIAIDLVNLDTVDEAAWRERRLEAMIAWLGDDLAAKLGPSIFQGFVQETTGDALLLASPAGEFVRAFRSGDRHAIERLVARTRPWLTRIALALDVPISSTLLDKLVAATPRLDEIVLRGRTAIDRLWHPAVRHVRLEGNVLGSLCWQGSWLTPPESFAIERVRQPSATADSRLYMRPTADWLRALSAPALRDHVTHLRAPATDPSVILRALAELPRTNVLEVVAHGARLDALASQVSRQHPRLQIVALDR